MTGTPISAEQRQRILALSEQGMSVAAISRTLSLCRNSVSKIRRMHGLLRKPRPFDEAEALTLLRSGLGYTEVARRLRVSHDRVHRLQLAHGLRSPMDRHIPVGDTEGFIAALRAIADGAEPQYVKALARKYKLSEDRADRIARKIIGCVAFVRGVGKGRIPLQHRSDWPRKCDVGQDRKLAGGA